MTDRERFGLRGSTQTCELHRTWYSRGCAPNVCETEERNDEMIVEFRPDGSIQRQWQKNPSPHDSEWTTFYEYNEANQLFTMRVEQKGTITTTRILEYNSEGRVSRVITPTKDGTQRVAEIYSYETDGRKKKITHIEPYVTCEGEGCGPMFGVDGTDAAYGAPGATTITVDLR